MTASTDKKFTFEPDITGLSLLLEQFSVVWNSFTQLLFGAVEASKTTMHFESEREQFVSFASDLVNGKNESEENYKKTIAKGVRLKADIRSFIEKLIEPSTANEHFDQMILDIRAVSEEIWEKNSGSMLESRSRFTAVAGQNHKQVVPAYAEVMRHLKSMKRQCDAIIEERKREQGLAEKRQKQAEARNRARQLVANL